MAYRRHTSFFRTTFFWLIIAWALQYAAGYYYFMHQAKILQDAYTEPSGHSSTYLAHALTTSTDARQSLSSTIKQKHLEAYLYPVITASLGSVILILIYGLIRQSRKEPKRRRHRRKRGLPINPDDPILIMPSQRRQLTAARRSE